LVFLLGDSHVEALRNGLSVLEEAESAEMGKTFSRIGLLSGAHRLREPFHARVGNEVHFTKDDLRNRFAAVTKGAGLLEANDSRKLIFRLGGHVIHFLRREYWKDFSAKSGATKSFVSSAALIQMCLDYDRHIISFYRDLREIGVSFKVCLAPPPSAAEWKRHSAIIENAEEFRFLVLTFRKTFADTLEAEGVSYIAPPGQALHEGLLREDLLSARRNDAYHANAEYGAMMLKHMAETRFLDW